jgi:PAS domain S-box-containing protein
MVCGLSRIVDALPALAWTALPDGHVDCVNQRWCEYTGLSPGNACDRGWQAAIHPKDLPDLLERWQAILASGEAGEMEARLRRFDGEFRLFHISSNPMRDEAGHIVKWCGVNTDIEDRRRAEESLRLRELNFQLIVDSIPVPVAVTTPTGEVESLNQSTLEFFGKTLEELRRWVTAADVIHPDDLESTVAVQKEAHRLGRSYSHETRHRRVDGVYRWFNNVGLPLRDTDGRILRWFSLQIDIDDRKRAEDALRTAERELVSIINTIPTSAWSTRPDGYCDFLNQRWLDYAGISMDQAQGWNWATAIHPDDWEALREYWQSALASGTPVDTEARIRRFDGVYRWFLFRANPLRDESGNIIKWYGTNVDIDDRKRSDEELSKARSELARVSRMTSLGALTASIAHEVTQPLAVMVTSADSCLQWLAKEPPNLERARTAAESVVVNGHRAGHIVESVRALARRSSSEMVMLDINRLIRDTLDLVQSEVHRHQVSLETCFLDTPRYVRGNPTQLQQVIVNLVMNGLESINATTGAPRILRVIADSDQNGGLLTIIEDSGSGIDPGIADRIFEPMFSTKPGGMGLGLSICRSIVEGHGGRLGAAPNPMGGSIFRFSIPKAADAASVECTA